MKIIYLAVALLLATVATSVAKDQPMSTLDQITPAWQRLDALTKSYMTKEQQITVQKLAFAAATADICDGFKIDKEKFISAFKAFDGEKQKELTTQSVKADEWKDKLLVAYGIATGLFTAEGMLIPDQFCSAAEDVRQSSTEHFWVVEQ